MLRISSAASAWHFLLAIVAFACWAVFAPAQADNILQRTAPWLNSTTSDELVELQPQGSEHVFAIPRKYLDMPFSYKSGDRPDAILMLVTIPDIEDRASHYSSMSLPDENQGSVFWNSQQKVPIEKYFEASALLWKRDRSVETTDTLYGLNHTVMSIPKSKLAFGDANDDIFVDNESNIKIYMICSNDSGLKNKNCTLLFRYMDLVVKVHFFRTRMTEWQNIMKRVTSRLDQWRK